VASWKAEPRWPYSKTEKRRKISATEREILALDIEHNPTPADETSRRRPRNATKPRTQRRREENRWG
jgi:hypothetical protein